MAKRVQTEEFLKRSGSHPILDVRSPSEYASGHIPGARSLPLFTDEERALIGTLYKEKGKKIAIKKGLEIVGPKMLSFIEQAEAFKSEELLLYCWRGGMRSDSMAWLLERYGFKTLLLEGGYKAYRNTMLAFFDQQLPLRVISGYTGSKKTLLLLKLKQKGEQVIDLEGLANHQGSSFGNKKSRNQPTTEQFQNMVYEAFRKLDLNRTIWIEDENMRVGKVNMAENLFHQKSKSPFILIEAAKEHRVDFLVEDYGHLAKNDLIDATQAIRKKLGYDNAKKAIEFIQAGDLKSAVEIILVYYDACYLRSVKEKKQLVTATYTTDLNNLDKLAEELIKDTQHAI